METDDVGKLQKEIRALKKQVERLEASRSTFELMVDRNDNLLSRQLEQTQHQAEELNRINLLADSALDLTKAGYWHVPLDGSGWYNSSERAVRIYGDPPSPEHRYHLDFWRRMSAQATKRPPRSRRRTLPPPSPAPFRCMTRHTRTSGRSMDAWSGSIPWGMW